MPMTHFICPDGEDLKRFHAKTIYARDGCVLWTGRLNGDGYGQFDYRGKTVLAHRFAYETAIGPIPAGLQTDHLCRNRACVNPGHLRAVTQKENILCGEGIAAVNARKTHCVHGHELTEDNVYLFRTSRCCRKCHYIHSRNHHAKIRRANVD